MESGPIRAYGLCRGRRGGGLVLVALKGLDHDEQNGVVTRLAPGAGESTSIRGREAQTSTAHSVVTHGRPVCRRASKNNGLRAQGRGSRTDFASPDASRVGSSFASAGADCSPSEAFGPSTPSRAAPAISSAASRPRRAIAVANALT